MKKYLKWWNYRGVEEKYLFAKHFAAHTTIVCVALIVTIELQNHHYFHIITFHAEDHRSWWKLIMSFTFIAHFSVISREYWWCSNQIIWRSRLEYKKMCSFVTKCNCSTSSKRSLKWLYKVVRMRPQPRRCIFCFLLVLRWQQFFCESKWWDCEKKKEISVGVSHNSELQHFF